MASPTSDPWFEALGAQDATFLDLEAPGVPQHVAAALVLDSGPLRTAEGGIDIERVRKYVASRLHAIPRYRQRLAWVPLTGRPVWVDDAHFQIDYHVRHTALPHPGDEEQLKRLAGRVLEQPLDRDRPLWELWVVEGLANGEQMALLQKVHHCVIDGVAGVDLMAVLLRGDADERLDPETAWEARPEPGGRALLSAELRQRTSGASGLVADVPEALRDPRALVDTVREGLGAVGEALGAGLRSASDTPLNRPLGPHRSFDWLSMELAELKQVKDRLGGTVNDVVLATVAGALRRFLTHRRVPLGGLRIRANVPVSLRPAEDRGETGNHIALWMTELPVDEPDPVARLRRVHETTEALKSSRQAQGAEVLAAVSEWTGSGLLSLSVRLSTRGRPYNLVVTNVPGPQIPLYLLGARATACYPVVNLLPNQGLGVALFSYAGGLYWGFTADPDQIPDLADFRDMIAESFAELSQAIPGDLRR
jgi:diacylglycerol O-acyltransferase